MGDYQKLVEARARNHLVGRSIKAVTYMTAEEADQYGWDQRGVVIVLDNDEVLIPMADDEGNGPGALATSIGDLTFGVMR